VGGLRAAVVEDCSSKSIAGPAARHFPRVGARPLVTWPALVPSPVLQALQSMQIVGGTGETYYESFGMQEDREHEKRQGEDWLARVIASFFSRTVLPHSPPRGSDLLKRVRVPPRPPRATSGRASHNSRCKP